MAARLRPTAPVAADAILVGDPGRALLLAQELLEQPKMSNHARGLWGYWGRTAEGAELTIQSTGMGAPSAAAVLVDLVELGVRRAVRVGTCAAAEQARLGELLLVSEAVAAEGSAAAFGLAAGAVVHPDRTLLRLLHEQAEPAVRSARVASFDTMPADRHRMPADAAGADMQTVALLAQGGERGIAVAALLIVTQTTAGESLASDELERCSRQAGQAARAALSNPQVED